MRLGLKCKSERKMPKKVIRDPVHGYITVSEDLCRAFVDTPLFQRLRSIEQTSMRWLFPGGRHDRFIHSLGVYHLAVRLYAALKENSDDDIKAILAKPELENTFVIAALMHDCGHAPFSHTTECFYNEDCVGHGHHNRVYKDLWTAVDVEARKEFNFHERQKKPADHEAMSALVLLSRYAGVMRSSPFNANPMLAARMITGATHNLPRGLQEEVENLLIKLINGEAIDVDKLDYVIRDTWASGVKNASIDVGRLLDAAAIVVPKKKKPVFIYRSTALSVVQTVIDARNYLYEWIYGHHTVLYYARMLTTLCRNLAWKLQKQNPRPELDSEKSAKQANEIFAEMFSVEALIDGKESFVENYGFPVHALTDGDMMMLFKRYCSETPEYVSYVSHNPIYFPLWKTEAEYRVLIDSDKHYAVKSKDMVARIMDHFKMRTGECFDCSGLSGKIYDIQPSAVNIAMPNGEVKSFTDVANFTEHVSIAKKQNPFFYIFVSNKHVGKKMRIIKFINDSQW